MIAITETAIAIRFPVIDRMVHILIILSMIVE